MKKRLLVMAMAGVALAGCVSDEVAEVAQKNEKQKITFGTPLSYDNSSRANVTGEISNPYPIKENFTIYATEYKSGEYAGWGNEAADFNNKTVTFDESVDGWAPKTDANKYYYWTDGMDMAFAACSPAELGQGYGTKSYGASGLTIENFKVNPVSKEQYDLMFSKRIYDVNASNLTKVEGQYSGIQLIFQHALSSIHFSICNETLKNEDVSRQVAITLKDITVSGVYDTGNFTENINEGKTGSYDKSYDKTTGGNVSPKWENTEQISTSVYDAFDAGELGLEFPSVQQYVSKYIEKNEELYPANQGKYGTATPLLLLPQTLPDEACIKVIYKIEGEDENKTKTVYFKDLKDEMGNALSSSWAIGTKYTYRLIYTDETAKKDRIYFAPSVEDWVNGGIISVYL